MKLIFDNIVGLGEKGLGADELRGEGEKIPGFLEGIKKRGQGFTELPRQKASVLAVKHLAAGLKGKFDDIVVLGRNGKLPENQSRPTEKRNILKQPKKATNTQHMTAKNNFDIKYQATNLHINASKRIQSRRRTQM